MTEATAFVQPLERILPDLSQLFLWTSSERPFLLRFNPVIKYEKQQIRSDNRKEENVIQRERIKKFQGYASWTGMQKPARILADQVIGAPDPSVSLPEPDGERFWFLLPGYRRGHKLD